MKMAPYLIGALSALTPLEVNDPLFPRQWNLRNTGQTLVHPSGN